MTILFWIIFTINILLGIIGLLVYLTHPLAGTRYVTYTGTKFWLVAFVCLVVLYLK